MPLRIKYMFPIAPMGSFLILTAQLILLTQTVYYSGDSTV